MNRTLMVVAFLVFMTSLFVRTVDPIIPQIAQSFAVDHATAALLSAAFALPYALIQPILGALGDMIGKYRMMKGCLVVLAVANIASSLAPTFELLMAARILAGAAAGGLLPVFLAVAGDLVPMDQRQVAISRLLAASLTGNILGATIAGIASDFIGWPNVFLGAGVIGFGVYAIATAGFRGVTEVSTGFALSKIVPGFQSVLANPLAKFCFAAVFLEGVFVYGLFPFVAALLLQSGETRASIAGIVISGFGVGGVIYSIFVAKLIGRFGSRGLMTLGPALMAGAYVVVALQPSWAVELGAFVVLGFGFYMLHACIQVYSTELAPRNRGSAVSLHSGFFFLGHSIGPVVYGFVFAQAGVAPMLLLAAIVINLVGLMCRLKLRQPNSKV
jgi:predicted MFS family arabinose efflux permease